MSPLHNVRKKKEKRKQLDDIWCHLKLTIVIISTVSITRLLDNYLFGRVLAHINKDHMTISTIFVIKYRTIENWKTMSISFIGSNFTGTASCYPELSPSPDRSKMEIRKCLDDFLSTLKSVFCKAILYININNTHFELQNCKK